ncbi:hypothetical protein AB3X94_22970 [Paraburkholderia sp. BR10923]|uniref:Uncharacterized protein n=1 Tax=Paraburkholderia youngii TaxID=2782701 RepID=A0A7Y6K7L3_9BURK|nr:hypothetical protein [Paraburkholderia youngii]NUY05079.1 hypothetical protein [Paraburkholderia youngii]
MRFYSSVNALLATVHSKMVRPRSVTITTTRCKSLRALFLRGALATEAGKDVPGTQYIAGWPFISTSAGPDPAPRRRARTARSHPGVAAVVRLDADAGGDADGEGDGNAEADSGVSSPTAGRPKPASRYCSEMPSPNVTTLIWFSQGTLEQVVRTGGSIGY